MKMLTLSRSALHMSLWVVAPMLLTGCNSDMTELEHYIAEVKARPAEPIPPIPPVKTYTPYTYEGVTGRDPFQPSTSSGSDETKSASSSNGPKPDFDRPKEYLERFELDTLSMVGTFSKGDSYWGLVRDPDGVVHRVAVNNYMGKNYGRVTAIHPSEIVLSELIPDGSGGYLVREASIALD